MCPKININLENQALRGSFSVIAICLLSRCIELYKQAHTTKNTKKIAKREKKREKRKEKREKRKERKEKSESLHTSEYRVACFYVL